MVYLAIALYAGALFVEVAFSVFLTSLVTNIVEKMEDEQQAACCSKKKKLATAGVVYGDLDRTGIPAPPEDAGVTDDQWNAHAEQEKAQNEVYEKKAKELDHKEAIPFDFEKAGQQVFLEKQKKLQAAPKLTRKAALRETQIVSNDAVPTKKEQSAV